MSDWLKESGEPIASTPRRKKKKNWAVTHQSGQICEKCGQVLKGHPGERRKRTWWLRIWIWEGSLKELKKVERQIRYRTDPENRENAGK